MRKRPVGEAVLRDVFAGELGEVVEEALVSHLFAVLRGLAGCAAIVGRRAMAAGGVATEYSGEWLWFLGKAEKLRRIEQAINQCANEVEAIVKDKGK